MTATNGRRTAAQTIVLAAATFAGEFTEWDLTVRAYEHDRETFGLRGYRDRFPDHKRVTMEIMGKKPSNPMALGLMERVRPNVYRLTPLGHAEAARLRAGGTARPNGVSNAKTDLYRTAADMVGHPAYEVGWKVDPDRPRLWADAVPFLALGGDAKRDPGGCLAVLRRQARAGVDWCVEHEVVYLTPASRSGGEPVHVGELAGVVDFLQVLECRFGRRLAGRADRNGGP